MKVLIIGAGALGSLIGGLLSGYHEVTILGRPEQVWVLNRKGLRIEGVTKGEFHPRASEFISKGAKFDLVVLCVKSYNTEMALDPLYPLLAEGTSILSLQNGLDNEEKLLRYIETNGLAAEVIGGITCHGVTYKGPGLVKHAGTGETIIGHYGGTSRGRDPQDWILKIAGMFTEAGIEVDTTTCINRELWAKTVINSAINPLTALLGKRNGVILEDVGVNETARDLIAEGVAIARLHGLDLTEEEMVERTMSVALRTRRNVSSMYQDIRRKRRTEVDSINGAICAKAEEMGSKAPLNRTMVRLIKALEEKNLE